MRKYRRAKDNPVLETATIAKFTAGESKSQIARDLGVHRETVARILNDDEIRQYVDYGRSKVASLIPKSIDVAENRLKKNCGTMAIAILRGTQVLRTTESVQINNNNFALLVSSLKQEPGETPAETAPKQLPEPPKP